MQAPRRVSDPVPPPPITTSHTSNAIPRFTLLVAGCSGGKSSFLRLLLDTSPIAPHSPKSQLADILNFVEACSDRTLSLRHTTFDLLGDLDGSERLQQFELTLIDTPSIHFSDSDLHSERLVPEILNLIDSRLTDALDEVTSISTTDTPFQTIHMFRRTFSQHHLPKAAERFITLCIYFLDPEKLVPHHPSSISHSRLQQNQDQSALFLDHQNVQVIRQLAERVNVLPVICKGDTLTNERLSAVKSAVRRDLAEAGIGFGIFDRYRPAEPSHDLPYDPVQMFSLYERNALPRPSSHDIPPIGGMPYTLISPDLFAHSDGVHRPVPSRAALMQQYTQSSPTSPLSASPPRGKYVRAYRWGVIDVLNPNQSDFQLLKFAVFRHLQTLHDYTQTYLFDKFKSFQVRPQSSDRSPPPRTVELSSRPSLAVHTGSGPSSTAAGGPSTHTVKPNHTGGSDSVGSNPSTSASGKSVSLSRPGRNHRSRKITVACQFCRSRKLKCDGGRPACSQCTKRSHPCDYLASRRRSAKRKEGEVSESESLEMKSDDNSGSPIVPCPPSSRQNRSLLPPIPHANEPPFSTSLPPMRPSLDQFDEPPPSSQASAVSSRYTDNELPHIATLSLPDISPTSSTPMPGSIFPLRPPPPHDTKHPAVVRKRSATMPTKSETGRLPGVSGPKIVACNFCRARKTKCDGANPCQQCAKRSLACNYVSDSGNRRGGRKAAGKEPPTAALSPSTGNGSAPSMSPEQDIRLSLNRNPEDEKMGQSFEDQSNGPPPAKRMRISQPSSPRIPH